LEFGTGMLRAFRKVAVILTSIPGPSGSPQGRNAK
jgi:hypothetical protein